MDIKEKVREFLYCDEFAEEFKNLSNDDSLLEKGIIDSVRMLELISFLEEKFQIRVEDEDLYPENFDSLTAIEDYVLRKISHKI